MIVCEHVKKIYAREIGARSNTALNDLSFNLDKGQILGLIGPNGAGKSTTIKLLMDFIRPTKGEIKLFNAPPSNYSCRKRIGYLPETAHFPDNLTVMDMLKFAGKTCSLSKGEVKVKSKELLSKLDLWNVRDRKLSTYSKGMQQRANFAIALINNPELLILDEPMSGLDPMGRKIVADLIVDQKEKGKTILFCSHILDDVDRLVDNVLILHEGRNLFFGKPSDLNRQEKEETLSDSFVHLLSREAKGVQ